MRKALQGIYKITNVKNDNCYIGQSLDIKRRWRNHTKHFGNTKDVAFSHYPLYRAFKKYGKDSFTFEIIELVHDKNKLTERELYWFEVFNPSYNILDPRDPVKTTHARPVLKIDIDNNNILSCYDSTREAERETGLTNIIKNCKGKTRTCGGFIWIYKEDYPQKAILRPHGLAKPVNQYTLNGEFISYFDSISQAERETGIKMRNGVTNSKETVGGYIWRYAEGGDSMPYKKKKTTKTGGTKK